MLKTAGKLTGYTVAVFGVIAVMVVFLPFRVFLMQKPGTVAFVLALFIVLVALRWGKGPVLVASVAGALAWKFLFLAPYLTLDFTRLDLADAALLLAFVATSLIIGQLAAHADQRAQEAASARSEVERVVIDLQRENIERRQTEKKFKRLLESAPDAMIIVDSEGAIRIVNSQTERLFGYTRAELVGQPIEKLMPQRFRSRHIDHRTGYVLDSLGPKARAMGQGLDLYGLHQDGHEFPIDVSLSPVDTEEGISITAAVRDVSERKRADATRGQLAAIVESSDDAIVGMSLGGVITSWNRGAERLYGYAAEEILGRSILTLEPADRSQEELQQFERVKGGEPVQHFETVRVHKDGRRVIVSLTLSAIKDASGRIIGVSKIARDVTATKQAEEQIRFLAQHDALTGLPNRLLFKDHINQAIAHAHRARRETAVLFIDLDHFKHINDSLGHQVGDRVLRLTGERLQQCVREVDSVARLGGDEFVVSVPAISGSSDAMAIADKLLLALRQPFHVDDRALHVSGSIGISLFPTDGADADVLMRAADTAMYYAKENGRNNYQFFTPRLNEAAQQRLTIANLLHHALQRQEFLVYYQPQIDLQTGRICAAEALLRWQREGSALTQPEDFLKIADDIGLTAPIGEWVLRQACEQVRRWRTAGYPDIQIAVNISPQQIRQPGFPNTVAHVLRETGVPPEALEIEITENAIMLENAVSKEILEQLVRLGVRLAIDDFGTGYSSLSYLRRFPIHTLKIDRSFIAGIGQDANDTAIVTAITAMACSLHLRVVAEGVETADQAEFVKVQGCAAAQGFHFSAAIAPESFSELLRARTA